jgi:hypothetical protein
MKSPDNSEAQTTTTPSRKFRNRDTAISQVCQAFAALGTLAGVDVDHGKGPDDINPDLIEAAYQSNFADPHFLGGPACFHYATTAGDVDAIAAKASVVTRGFASYIRNQGCQETLQKAEEHIALIDAAIVWLRKTRRSP